MTPADYAAMAVRNHANRLLKRIKRDPDEVIAQRRDDLLADVRRFYKRRKRDRFVRQAATK